MKDRIIKVRLPQVRTKKHRIDINSLIYIEPDKSLDIKMEYMEKGLFIDKKICMIRN